MVADACALGSVEGRKRRSEGVQPGLQVGLMPGRQDRGLVGLADQRHLPARRERRHGRGAPPRSRPVLSEGCDRADAGRGGHAAEVEPSPQPFAQRSGFDHDPGAVEQGGEHREVAPVAGVGDEAALSRVQRCEEDAGVGRLALSARGQPARRVTAGRLDFDDIGPKRREELRRERPRDIRRQVVDANAAEDASGFHRASLHGSWLLALG